MYYDWLAVAYKMFPFTKRENINKHLPDVLAALKKHGLDDRSMTLVALATIRAETESFEPVSEGQSKYNTAPGGHPFGLYDTRSALGNHGWGDGAAYRGRGFIQLTGRGNYATYGERLKLKPSLLDAPEQANHPAVAAEILALFLKDKERRIRDALVKGDLATVRKAVNGGSHGLERFKDAYYLGEAATEG